jgi:hypothetical protein
MTAVALEPAELLRASWLDEPMLRFADSGRHVDPKSGIARFGPYSLRDPGRHPHVIKVGLIGPAELLDQARTWLTQSAEGVTGDESDPEFPGFVPERGYGCRLAFAEGWTVALTQSDQRRVLDTRSQRDRFEAALELHHAALRQLDRKDSRPDCVFIVFSDDFLRRCRVANYSDKVLGRVHRDLRRSLKAAAMQYRFTTQLLAPSTFDGRDRTPASKIAWNIFTGLYCKAGGIPWAPDALPAGTCFLGIGFFRPHGSETASDDSARARMQSSLVQAYDEHGEGLVLRGEDFEWDPRASGTPSPHLSLDQAARLVRLALERYERDLGHRPRRVVVHKTSRYWPGELEGFRSALADSVRSFDLLALHPQNRIRLLTTAKYPALRGTRFAVGNVDFLYTTGFVPALGEYHGVHVPSPLQVADHVGQDTSREQLLREVLTLTKLNWNSAQLGGLEPITTRFSRLVGDVLREVPADREPLPQFKYYV